MDLLENSCAQILSLLAKKPEFQHDSPHDQDVSEGADGGIPTPVRSVASAEGQSEVALLCDTDPETSLNTYRRMSAKNFPFVIVPEATSAAVLSQKRPMLARAIAIATSWSSPNEQSAKRALFLNDLSAKYFVRCERSLDLLQALIVYFGW